MMLKMFMAGLLATQAATVSPPAPPAAPPCLTREQFGHFGVVAVAMFVGIAQNVCRSHLRPDAFMISAAGNAYIGTLRAEGRNRLRGNIDAVVPMMPGGAASPTLMRGMFTALLGDDAGREWARFANPALCRDADEIIEATSVMTPDRTARFFGAFASLADQVYRMIPPPTPRPANAPASQSKSLANTPTPEPPAAMPPAPPRRPMPPFLCRQGQ